MKKEYLAHISEDGREQTVMEHLENTAELCAGFAKEFGAEEQGYLIGIAHDIGKCSEAFQQRLHGGHIVDHASAGALECAKLNALWAACCVAGHHGGLPDVGNMRNDAPGEPTLFGRLQSAIHHLIPVYRSSCSKRSGILRERLSDRLLCHSHAVLLSGGRRFSGHRALYVCRH